ncbi:hypothetical protein GMA92_12610 [Turicibacter sanguinis]|uniref:Uncharacterized protein n=1 Tax=Turicibacter sanguinis TaxID=154288 RepID=A0A9X4XJJ9_9FIRM|nr:hypothetical protein GAZ90_21760 [Phocaeicola vulgatus]MTK22252.1 hypothetical protein [Turicibacter sanguinis]MTK73780.1 hypothetical protein [Turicibacter sanguinis]
MNGLEAIELMKQGSQVSDGEYVYKIENNLVLVRSLNGKLFNIDNSFDFTSEYEEYIEPKPLTGWERVDGKMYNVIVVNDLGESMECGQSKDYMYYKQANYFSTKEKAEEIIFKQTLFRKLQRFSDENGGNEIDWNNEIKMKWGIWYNHKYEELASCPYVYGQAFGQVYFISEEVAEKAIELFRDELIKYFTHDWSGKDETPINLNSEER